MLDSTTDGRKHLCMATGEEDCKYSIIWIISIFFLAGLSAGLGFAVNGEETGLWAPLVSHGIQWVVCVCHAFPFQTEHYYDLTGSLTYILLTCFTLAQSVITAAPIAYIDRSPEHENALNENTVKSKMIAIMTTLMTTIK